MSRSSDVLISGAGPAGSFLAFLLARQGVDVVLLDKARFPRYKPCGGGLTPKTFKMLHKHGIRLDGIEEVPVRGAWNVYQGRNWVRVDRPEPAKVVMREFLDGLLVNRAAEAGVRFFDEVRVKRVQREAVWCVDSTDGVYKAQTLVGADGATGVVRKQLGLPPRYHITRGLEVEFEVPATALEQLGGYAVFDWGACPKGYGWIFPKHDHFSIGVYSFDPAVPLKPWLERFRDTHPLLKVGRELKRKAHPLVIGGEPVPVTADNALLVGDAAGVCDAFFAEGISYALWTALKASKYIVAHLAEPRYPLAGYQQDYNLLCERYFQPALLLSRWFYLAPKQTFRLLAANRYASDLFAGVLFGEHSFHNALATLLRHPHTFLTARWRDDGPQAAPEFADMMDTVYRTGVSQ